MDSLARVEPIAALAERSGELFKGWLAIAKIKTLSLFISLLLMLKKALDNVKKEKWKVKVVSALQ